MSSSTLLGGKESASGSPSVTALKTRRATSPCFAWGGQDSLRRDPRIHALVQQIERQRPIDQQGVVEGPHVEPIA